jgi:hypothetical protein
MTELKTIAQAKNGVWEVVDVANEASLDTLTAELTTFAV